MNHTNCTTKIVSNGLLCEEKGNLAHFPHRLCVANGKNHGNRQLALFFEREFHANFGDNVTKFEDKHYKWSPAHWAAYFGDLPCLNSLFSLVGRNLLDEGNSTFCQTPLHVAAFAGQTECVQWMIEQGASVNKVDCLNETALHKCARTANIPSAVLLLRNGADEQIVSKDGLTAERMAIVCGNWDLWMQISGQVAIGNGINHQNHSTILSSSLIRQGLNGGHLPDTIPNETTEEGMEIENMTNHSTDGVGYASQARKRSSCDGNFEGKIKRMRSQEEAHFNGQHVVENAFCQPPICNGVNGYVCDGLETLNGGNNFEISIYAYNTLIAEMHGS